MPLRETVRNLPVNSRFYILLIAVFGSVLLASYLRQQISGDQLFVIRLAQICGFTSLGFLYVALIISPLSKLFPKWRGMKQLRFARRAIGVSAFYFALLHFMLTFWFQLGGWSALKLLPNQFIVAISFGFTMLVILLLMTVTSFDKAIQFMTYRRWKWLHRSVYIGGILIILHVWMIGTHAAYGSVQLIGVVLLGVLFALEAVRVGSLLADRFPRIRQNNYLVTLIVYIWLFCMSLLVIMAGRVQSYHGAKQQDKAGHSIHE